MQNLNKVIYALGLSTLLYLAEEIGRKRGHTQAMKFCTDTLFEVAENAPDKPLKDLLSEYGEQIRSEHTRRK